MKRKSSVINRRVQKFMSNRLAILGFVVIVIMLVASLAAPLLTSADPSAMDPINKFQPPSAEHILGTDQLGRDLFARVLYGGRVSILIGLSSAILSTLLGVFLGCICGYFGGKVDDILLKI